MGEQKGTKPRAGTQRLRFGLSMKRGLEFRCLNENNGLLESADHIQTGLTPDMGISPYRILPWWH